MKATMTRLLVLLLALVCVLGLVACGTAPETDLEDAKDALEDAGYEVYYDDDIEEPGMEESLSANDDDEYIRIYRFEKASTAKLYYETLKLEHEYELKRMKAELKLMKHMLSKYEDDLDRSEVKEFEDEIEDLEEDIEEFKDEYVIGRRGKVVWYGTKQAAKDSK